MTGGLLEGEVHVWRADLDAEPAERERLGAFLDGEERARAAAFHFDRDRHRFVVARGTLRELLGDYLGRPPGSIALRYGEYGKPSLEGGTLAFNVSHSAGVGLFAFGTAALGVDVEVLAPQADLERLAARFFAPGETARLLGLEPELRDWAFLECWTRKEAFVKARGDGLTLPLDEFEVTFGPGEPSALAYTAWSPAEPDRWQITDISDPAAGLVAAIASPARDWRVRLLGLPDSTDVVPIPQETT